MTTTDQINAHETEIHELKIKIRLLKQIQHFEMLHDNALMILDAIPDSMKKTSAIYYKRAENYRSIVFNLKNKYGKFGKK